MSYTPISGGFSTALSGIVEPSKFIDFKGLDGRNDDLTSRRIHSPSEKTKTIKYSIIIVIISAILFVTIIALYDVLRSSLNIYFANKSLVDPNSHNSEEDIQRTEIANQNALWSSITFAGICLILAVILITLLIYVFHLI